MALLGVGIHTGLVLSKVQLNKTDNGESLDVAFKEAGHAVGSGALDFLNTGSTGSGNENNIKLFPVNSKKYGTEETKDGDTILNELLAQKDTLAHVALAYLPSDQVKFNLTEGLTGITTKEDLVKQITKQATLDKLTHNLFTQFEGLMKQFVDKSDETVVVKFSRKSDASNFPVFPKFAPFIANTKDEKTVAKIKYSAWEIANKKDSNAQSLDGADSQNADELASQTAAVNSVFG